MSDFARLRARARDIVEVAGALVELDEFLTLLAQASQIRLDTGVQVNELASLQEQVEAAGATLAATRQTTADEIREAKDSQQRILATRESVWEQDFARKKAKASAELDDIAAQVAGKKADLEAARQAHRAAVSTLHQERATVEAQIKTLTDELAGIRARLGLPVETA